MSAFMFSSAYEQKRAGGGAKSSCPGTPMSPMQQHYSPKPATAGRPDAGFMNPTASSQPLPSNSYPINARWRTARVLEAAGTDILPHAGQFFSPFKGTQVFVDG